MGDFLETVKTWCTGTVPLEDGEGVGRHYDEAMSLARRAYDDRDASVRSVVERALYLLSVHNSFACPAEVVPAVYWTVFSRAVLRNALSLSPSGCGPSELRERMKAAVIELGAHNHPLVPLMDERPEVFALWSKNWYGSTHGYTFQMTSIAQRLAPESDIGAHTPTVFRNLADELEDEFSGTPHHHLRYRIVQGVGCSYDVFEGPWDEDLSTEAFALVNVRTAMAAHPSPFYALGNVYGIEGNWVLETPRLARLLGRAGYDPKMYESYELHAKLDVEHANEWLDMLSEIPMTPAQVSDVLAGTIAGLTIRRQMYDRILERVS